MSSQLPFCKTFMSKLPRAAFALPLLASFAAQADPLPPLPDPALNACLQQQAELNGWLDAEQVQELNCVNQGVTDLIGLEMLPNLRVLDVRDNALQAIMPLDSDSAPSLHYLDLSGNTGLQLEHVNWVLARQYALTYLGVAGIPFNAIMDLQFANKDILQGLNVSSTGVTSVMGIESFTHLSRVDLSGNPLVDVFPLESLTQLRELNLAHTSIDYLPMLSSMGSLENLNLSGNRRLDPMVVESLLANLPQLKHLFLADVSISADALQAIPNPHQLLSLDVSGSIDLAGFPFDQFSRLEVFAMRGANLHDAYFLSQLPYLHTVDLSHNRLHYLPFLASSMPLQHLNVAYNDLSHLESGEQFSSLVSLDLSGNSAISLDYILSPLHDLRSLGLAGIPNAFDALHQLPNRGELRRLNLSDTGMDEYFDVYPMHNLRELDISDNRVEFIGGLDFSPQLRVLRANNNLLRHIPPFAPGASLNELHLAGNNLVDGYELANLHHLTHLDLSGNTALSENDLLGALSNNAALQSLGLDRLGFKWHWLNQLQFPERLRALSVEHSRLDYVDNVYHFPNLEVLNLRHNRLTDAYFLDMLPRLRELDIAHNLIASYDNPPALPSLHRLSVSHNPALSFAYVNQLVGGADALHKLAASGIKIPQGEMYHFVFPHRLTELELAETGLRDAFMLHDFPALRYLDVSNNELYQLHGIEQLVGLRHLDVSKNDLVELGGLEYVTGLRQLNVSYNPFAAEFVLTQLYHLDGLQSLAFAGMGLGELQQLQLARPTILKTLDVSDNHLESVNGVEMFAALQWLHADNNALVDVYALSYLADLRGLNLRYNQLQQLHGVGGQFGQSPLTHLRVEGNSLMDLEPLSALSKLEIFSASSGDHLDTPSLANELERHAGLTELYLSGFQLTEVSMLPLPLLEGLEVLQLSHGQLQSLNGLHTMPHLRELYLDHNELTDLYGVEYLQRLRKLDVSMNSLHDLHSSAMPHELQLLDISGNSNLDLMQVNELLMRQYDLESLAVSDLPISGLDELMISNSHLLESLSVTNAGLVSLFGIEQMPHLRHLDLSYNQLQQFPEGLALPYLQQLNLRGNDLTEVHPLNLMAMDYALTRLNLLENHRIECEQLDHLQTISSLQLQRPESCQWGQPPELVVFSPSANDLGVAGELITFSANGHDWEDGDLSQDIVWVSDIDGLLGHGPLLEVALNAGLHRITVSVQDSHGNRDQKIHNITVEPAAEYCVARGSQTYYEWINRVSLNGDEVTSGADGGYGDFTDTVFPLNFGMNQMTLGAGYSYGSYWEHWGVWVDFNGDGQFSDDEQVVANYGVGTFMQYFMLPPDVRSGTTRMRVVMTYDRAASPCGTFYYGEVEDYSVVIP